MNKKLIKILGICVVVMAIVAGSIAAIVTVNNNNKKDKLVIYNWADYIDPTILDEFEEYYYEKTGKEVEVIYSLFDTNETMMTEVTKSDSQIDLICPSEYSIQKLMSQGLLQKIEMSEEDYEYIGNIYPAIRQKVKEVFDDNGIDLNSYFVPYMWGTMGILYNTKYVTEEDIASGWGILWNAANNPDLEGKILMKDSVREVYVASVIYLKEYGYLEKYDAEHGTNYNTLQIGSLINLVDENLLAMCEEVMMEERNHVKGYEVDFGKDDMINEVAYVNLAWSGDALYAIEEGETYIDENGEECYQLDYYVPEVGSNVWFDGWAIPTTAQNVEAAYEFINFCCRPDIAMRNMMEIGYSCYYNPDEFINPSANNKEYNDEAILYLVECEYAWEITDEEIAELYPDYDNNVTKANGLIYSITDEDGVTTKYDITDFFTDIRRYPDFQADTENKLGVMQDFGENNDEVVAMWERVKGGDGIDWRVIVASVGIVAGIALIFAGIVVIRIVKSKRRIQE